VSGCSKEQAKSGSKEQAPVQSATQNSASAASPQNTPASQPDAQVAADLAKFIPAVDLAMKPWVKVIKLTDELPKAKTEKAYASKLRKEFVPIVTGVLTQMAAIKPATKEVQAIHNTFLSSLKDYLAGLQSMADAVEKKDDALVNESAKKLNAYGPAYEKFVNDTGALATINNIKFK
jgi:hypothetical protein